MIYVLTITILSQTGSVHLVIKPCSVCSLYLISRTHPHSKSYYRSLLKFQVIDGTAYLISPHTEVRAFISIRLGAAPMAPAWRIPAWWTNGPGRADKTWKWCTMEGERTCALLFSDANAGSLYGCTIRSLRVRFLFEILPTYSMDSITYLAVYVRL